MNPPNLWRGPRFRADLPEHRADRPLWLELFYDLVYVALFIQIGEVLSGEVTWLGVGKTLVLFAPIWWAWSNIAFYMNRFFVDDVWHRVVLLVQIVFIAWLGVSVGGAFGELSTQFVLLYVGFRLTMVALYWRTLKALPETRPLLQTYIVQFQLIGTALWLLSLLLPPPWRFTLWTAAFVFEALNTQHPRVLELHRQFPLHPGHLVERFGTLIILVLGETFIKGITLDTSLAMTGVSTTVGALGTALLFGLWWLYFASHDEAHHEPRVDSSNPLPWIYLHLPLSFALIAFGVGTKKLFEASFDGRLNPSYVVLFLGALVLYLAVLALLEAGPRRIFCSGSALVLAGATFLAVRGHWSAVGVVGVAFAVVGAQVLWEVVRGRREA